MSVVCLSIVISIFFIGYAFADISNFPDTEYSPICKWALWVYLWGSSLAFVFILVFLGHYSVCEVKWIAWERGISSISYNKLWVALYINIVCEIFCGIQDLLYYYEYDNKCYYMFESITITLVSWFVT